MDGPRPVDGLMPVVLDSAAVQMVLLPMRGGGGGLKLNAKEENGQRVKESPGAPRRTLGERRRGSATEEARVRRSVTGTRMRRRCLAPFWEKVLAADCRNTCASLNLPGGCSFTRQSGKCRRSFHVCCKPGCATSHPLAEHPG